MQAIIFANRNGNELAPLHAHYCPALLPVGNKAVIEFTLEDLAEAQIDRVRIVISAQSAAIEKLIGNGEKWGLDVEYFLSREQEAVSNILPRLALNPNEAILLARADMLRSPCIKSFVQFSQQMSTSHVVAKIANKNAGLMMLPGAKHFTEDLNWPLANSQNTNQSSEQSQSVTQILHGNCFMLDSLQDYMSANQAIASAKLTGITPKGRYFSSASKVQGFYLGAKTKTGQLRMHDAWGVIGKNTWIDESVDMQQSIIVGKNCLVEKACSLNNCLILDNTYIGQGLNVSNAIVCEDLLIMPENGGHLTLTDPSIISDNSKLANRLQPLQHVSTLDRLQALVMFSIGLFFAPLLMLISLITQPKQPLIREYIFIKGGKKATWRWNLSPLFIARLPQLYWVFTGRLALFGATPFEAKVQTTKQHNPIGLATSLGLYGPLQLVIDAAAPIEEREFVEAEYLCINQRSKYWSLVSMSIFTKSVKHKTPINTVKQ
ncbi:sugar phosphate nucleotidyltransferase [Shewanella sp. GutDb-MelDb]|uniref:sugar phosphate nucleotidyltransferase n=1 Tax=Shewanella sp. GutDb-MelDb TaxID=2058316 RepID=UPI000C7AAC5B|nr:NDP-sugar synthase [Shewanella sp. GutDb-MelDb]PKG56617.1 nucleotidyl transferase [Shewanella sp. GutDb-MelDb]